MKRWRSAEILRGPVAEAREVREGQRTPKHLRMIRLAQTDPSDPVPETCCDRGCPMRTDLGGHAGREERRFLDNCT